MCSPSMVRLEREMKVESGSDVGKQRASSIKGHSKLNL